jgi:hypothetical protein
MSARQFSDHLISRLGHLSAALEAEAAVEGERGATPSSLYLALGLTPPVVPAIVAEEVSPGVRSLCQRRCQAFARIVQCLANQHGDGDIEILSADRLAHLTQEAHDLADRWEEDEPVTGWVCDTELKRLLQAHNELGGDIVYEADLAEDGAERERDQQDKEVEEMARTLKGRSDLVDIAMKAHAQIRRLPHQLRKIGSNEAKLAVHAKAFNDALVRYWGAVRAMDEADGTELARRLVLPLPPKPKP